MKLLKFYMDTCGPCKAVSQFINEINPPNIIIVDVDAKKTPDVTQAYEVKSVPTLILLDSDGNEIKRSVGFKPKADLEAFLVVDNV